MIYGREPVPPDALVPVAPVPALVPVPVWEPGRPLGVLSIIVPSQSKTIRSNCFLAMSPGARGAGSSFRVIDGCCVF